MVSSEARIIDEIRDKPSLTLGLVRSDPVTLVHWMVLGNQACAHSLPKLESVREDEEAKPAAESGLISVGDGAPAEP